VSAEFLHGALVLQVKQTQTRTWNSPAAAMQNTAARLSAICSARILRGHCELAIHPAEDAKRQFNRRLSASNADWILSQSTVSALQVFPNPHHGESSIGRTLRQRPRRSFSRAARSGIAATPPPPLFESAGGFRKVFAQISAQKCVRLLDGCAIFMATHGRLLRLFGPLEHCVVQYARLFIDAASSRA